MAEAAKNALLQTGVGDETQLAAADADGVPACGRIILLGEQVAQQHVDLARLLVDHIDQQTELFTHVAQLAGRAQIDMGDGSRDTKGFGQLLLHLGQARQLESLRQGLDIDG